MSFLILLGDCLRFIRLHLIHILAIDLFSLSLYERGAFLFSSPSLLLLQGIYTVPCRCTCMFH